MKRSVVLISLVFLLIMNFVVVLSDENISNEIDESSTQNEIISNLITEQVTCIFKNSNEVQKCYTIDNSFYCSGTKEEQSCGINVSGDNGEELSWMSSCHTYNITIIDGIDKTIEFDCTQVTERVPVEGYGYVYAEFQCFDDPSYHNLTPIQETDSCKSYDTWVNIAKELCKNKCGPTQVEIGKGIYETTTKCGLKSVGVAYECQLNLLDRIINWIKKLFNVG